MDAIGTLALFDGVGTHNRYGAIRREQGSELGEELEREEVEGLRAAGEDVVDYVVVTCFVEARDECEGVVVDNGDGAGELEVLGREVADCRVDFNDGGVDAVGCEGRWACSDAEASELFVSWCFENVKGRKCLQQ